MTKVAISPKFGIALLAAAAAMTYGAPAAHAALGDLAEPATSTVEETVADTTSAAQETTETVTDTVDQAAATTPLSDTVDTATSTVDQTVAGTTAAVQETTTTVGNAVNDAAATVDHTSQVSGTVGGVITTVKATNGAGQTTPSPASGAVENSATSGPGTTGQPGGSETAVGATSAGVPRATPASVDTSQTTSNHSGAVALQQHQAGHSRSALQPIPARLSAGPQGTSGTGPDGSGSGPRIPVPFLPLSIPAGGAPAGAAGVTLLALLLGVFVLATPRAGRRLRPGPILGWSPPFLSRQERPG